MPKPLSPLLPASLGGPLRMEVPANKHGNEVTVAANGDRLRQVGGGGTGSMLGGSVMKSHRI